MRQRQRGSPEFAIEASGLSKDRMSCCSTASRPRKSSANPSATNRTTWRRGSRRLPARISSDLRYLTCLPSVSERRYAHGAGSQTVLAIGPNPNPFPRPRPDSPSSRAKVSRGVVPRTREELLSSYKYRHRRTGYSECVGSSSFLEHLADRGRAIQGVHGPPKGGREIHMRSVQFLADGHHIDEAGNLMSSRTAMATGADGGASSVDGYESVWNGRELIYRPPPPRPTSKICGQCWRRRPLS